MGILKSSGLKRKIAAILSILVEVAASIPELAPILPILQYIAGFFGVVGIVHGVAAKNVSTFKFSTLASFLTALAAISSFIPALAPYQEWLQKAAAIIGGIVLGTDVPETQETSIRATIAQKK